MLYAYIVISAVLITVLDRFFCILRQTYSWWLAPCLLAGCFLGFVLLQLLIFVLMIFFTNRDKPCDKGAKFFRFLVKHSLPIIVWAAGVRVDFKAEKELPSDTRMLFVCNHQHDFDPIIMLSVFPDSEIGFIGKKEIYKTMPFISKAMHRLYSLPIDRENDREAAKTIVKAIKTIKDDKASMALFPEGYTSKSCVLLPFRNGSFKIAVKANVPIAVCVINNTREIPKNMFRRRTTVDFKLIDVIFPEEFENLNTSEIGDRIYEEMNNELLNLRKGR